MANQPDASSSMTGLRSGSSEQYDAVLLYGRSRDATEHLAASLHVTEIVPHLVHVNDSHLWNDINAVSVVVAVYGLGDHPGPFSRFVSVLIPLAELVVPVFVLDTDQEMRIHWNWSSNFPSHLRPYVGFTTGSITDQGAQLFAALVHRSLTNKTSK